MDDFHLLHNHPILTSSELAFYNQLRGYLNGSPYFLFSKIALKDLMKIYGKRSPMYRPTFNKISKKHIDFIITDTRGQIVKLIELDDRSHENEQTKKNDDYKDEVFRYLQLDLVRYFVGKPYDFGKLGLRK